MHSLFYKNFQIAQWENPTRSLLWVFKKDDDLTETPPGMIPFPLSCICLYS